MSSTPFDCDAGYENWERCTWVLGAHKLEIEAEAEDADFIGHEYSRGTGHFVGGLKMCREHNVVLRFL